MRMRCDGLFVSTVSVPLASPELAVYSFFPEEIQDRTGQSGQNR
jgi:hypothetical protein